MITGLVAGADERCGNTAKRMKEPMTPHPIL